MCLACMTTIMRSSGVNKAREARLSLVFLGSDAQGLAVPVKLPGSSGLLLALAAGLHGNTVPVSLRGEVAKCLKGH